MLLAPTSKPTQFNVSSMLPLGYQIADVRWKPCSEMQLVKNVFNVLYFLGFRLFKQNSDIWKQISMEFKTEKQSDNIFGLIFMHNINNFHVLVCDMILKSI